MTSLSSTLDLPALPPANAPFGHALRPHWSLDPAITFLNHGSFGATPLRVQAVQRDWQAQMESEPVRFMMDVLPSALSAAGAALADFVGAKPENLVFVDNATAGANAVLRSIDWRRGDRVVIANHGYPALKIRCAIWLHAMNLTWCLPMCRGHSPMVMRWSLRIWMPSKVARGCWWWITFFHR